MEGILLSFIVSLAKVKAMGSKNDITAQAMRMVVKEQRAQRRKRQGKQAPSSDDEDDKSGFDCTASLKKYGLERIKPIHMMKNKDVKEYAKKAAAKAQDNEEFLVGDDVLKFPPQWLAKDNPRALDKNGMSHAVWVANWWSRSLTQIAAQGHAENSFVSVQDLLNEFLNINRLAVEGKSEGLAWAYDKYIWNDIQQRTERKEENVNLQEIMTTVVKNDVDMVSQGLRSYTKYTGDDKGKGSFSKGLNANQLLVLYS